MTSTLAKLFALALLCVADAAHAQYRWTDADGRVNFGDQPPAGAKNVQRIGEAGGSTAAPDLPYELRIAVERFPVTLYTSANCAPCTEARNLLRARGVPAAERIVTYKEEAEKMIRDGLGTQMPVVTVGRQVVRGFNAGALTRELDAAGYPAQSRLPATWRQQPAQPLLDAPKAQQANTPPPAEETQREPVNGVATPDQPLIWPRPTPPAENK